MITFAEAREIVFESRGIEYPEEAEFVVSEKGWENDEYYQLVAGPYAMVAGVRGPADLQWLIPEDGPYITVHKITGEYKERWGYPPFKIDNAVEIAL